MIWKASFDAYWMSWATRDLYILVIHSWRTNRCDYFVHVYSFRRFIDFCYRNCARVDTNGTITNRSLNRGDSTIIPSNMFNRGQRRRYSRTSKLQLWPEYRICKWSQFAANNFLILVYSQGIYIGIKFQQDSRRTSSFYSKVGKWSQLVIVMVFLSSEKDNLRMTQDYENCPGNHQSHVLAKIENRMWIFPSGLNRWTCKLPAVVTVVIRWPPIDIVHRKAL